MKKIFILMLAVVFALSASACRESEKNSDIFIGEWKISGAQIGGRYIDSRLFIELGVNEFESFSLVLEPDGKAIISSEGQQQETDWQENENGVKVGGAKLEYRDEALWIDTEQGNLRLEKAGSSDEEITDESSRFREEESDAIRPEFKRAMDSYEQFFDEYISFMERYSNATTEEMLSLISDYADYMTKFTQTMEALEKLENSEMNEAEAVYYAQVSARISEKLMSVVG